MSNKQNRKEDVTIEARDIRNRNEIGKRQRKNDATEQVTKMEREGNNKEEGGIRRLNPDKERNRQRKRKEKKG